MPRTHRSQTIAIHEPARPIFRPNTRIGARVQRTAHMPTSEMASGKRVSPRPRSAPERTIETPNSGSEIATMRSIFAACSITAGSEEKMVESGVAKIKSSSPIKVEQPKPTSPDSLP